MNEVTNSPTASTTKYLSIDEHGYPVFDAIRVTDETLGKELIKNMAIDKEGRAFTKAAGQDYLVEFFDEPLVAQNVEVVDGTLGKIHLPYGQVGEFKFDSLCADEWDRFHGRTDKKVPFVFSRAAQAELFNRADKFDDDSITFKGKTYNIAPLFQLNQNVQSPDYWSKRYAEESTKWELNAPATALRSIMPQLKLSSQRIAVLGAGSCEDAGYLASLGHFVTAIDFSGEAIARARKKFSQTERLKFIECDIFHLPASLDQSFDLIFEHTCYSAVDPTKRSQLVKVWNRLLTPQGHLLGVFFAIDKRQGPPFGGSEWELKKRLDKYFRPLYWTRWREENYPRAGQELVVFAQKSTKA
jgi:SAM-dependent methyltransferase